MDGYDRLAVAIIEQTCEDYIAACTKLESSKNGFDYKEETLNNALFKKNSCLAFFKGDWIVKLMPKLDVDGLLEQLDEKVQDIVAERVNKYKYKLSR